MAQHRVGKRPNCRDVSVVAMETASVYSTSNIGRRGDLRHIENPDPRALPFLSASYSSVSNQFVQFIAQRSEALALLIGELGFLLLERQDVAAGALDVLFGVCKQLVKRIGA